jgi:hypothetical protein
MFFESIQRVVFANLWDKHDGVIALHFRIHRSKRLAKKSFNAVSLYAFAVSFAYGNTHIRLFGRTVDYGQRRGKRALTLGKKFLKVRLFFQSKILHFSCFFAAYKKGKSSPLGKGKEFSTFKKFSD